MKRWLALLVTASISVSALAGCGAGSEADTDASAEVSEDGAAETGSEAAGNAAEIDFDEEPYEATLMYWVANDARDVQAVEDAFNELTLSQLNMKVNLQPVTLGTYGQQITMILSSDDPLDIFPMWGAQGAVYADSDYIVDMSEYLEEYGQDIIEIVGREDIECGRNGDFLTGIPNMHERTNPTIFVMPTDILAETGYSAEDIHAPEDMTKVFEKVHELYPEMTVYGGMGSFTYPIICANAVIDGLGSGCLGVLLDEGQSTTIENWYESEEFINACKLVRSWSEAGYTSADFATCTDMPQSMVKAGNLFCYSTNGKPNSKLETDTACGCDTTCIQVNEGACFTTATSSIVYSISSNSEDPAKAMMLLNWIYATKEANDLLNWGVEGKDYVVTEDGTIDYPEGVTADNVGYHQDFGWAQPNQYNSYVWKGNDPGIWDEYQKVRDNAAVSKAYGFTFDVTPVVNEVSALTAVVDEYMTSIATGSVDTDTALAEFNEKLYNSGLQKVMDEKQAQLDAWLAQQ